MFTDSVSSAALEKAISATWQRAQLITHNLANEDTPGYKAKKLEFETLLNRELGRSNMRVSTIGKSAQINRIQSVRSLVYDDDSTTGRIDGNNVDKDAEQIELARVQIQYQALRDKINGHYSTLKYAISGGR